MTAEHLEIGAKGEGLAVEFLKAKKYSILGRNYKTKFGEIDIIASIHNILVFVEVKTRIGNTFGTPEEAVTPRKIREVVMTAEYYYLLHPDLPKSFRIDCVAIELYPDRALKELRHIENITQ